MTINERIKELRNALHLTQIEFGEKVGISQGHLTSIESGRRNVTSKSLKVICLQFGANEKWLSDGEGDMFTQDDQSIIRTLKTECGANDRDAKIIEAYLRLPDEYREAIKRFAINLAENLAPDDEKVDK